MAKRKRTNVKARPSKNSKNKNQKVADEVVSVKRRKTEDVERTQEQNTQVDPGSKQFPRIELPPNPANDPYEYIDGRSLYLDEITVLELEGCLYDLQGSARGTTVYKATRVEGDWEDKEVVVKLCIYTHREERTGEDEFVKKALDKANELGDDHAWAKEHLPKILWSKTYDELSNDTPQYRLAKSLRPNFPLYKDSILCITVQSVLQPLIDLDKPKEYAQVYFDVLQIHRWLIDHPKILQRDISRENIMFRREADGTIRGVLNDFDHASELPPPPGPWSLKCTGATPYMSCDALDQDWEKGHHYRHDLEALFYVILIVSTHYEERDSKIQRLEPETRLPYHSWYADGAEAVRLEKFMSIYMRPTDIATTSFFSGFKHVLFGLRAALLRGWLARQEYEIEMMSRKRTSSEPKPSFDWQTLGGKVSYETLKAILCEFDGETLIERYKERFMRPIQESDFVPPGVEQVDTDSDA
ncbi:hypothetical protein VKT23_003447 [Stygiomarasmius scandens]|uniref:Fungal-type protein kinase domain-containing protein n=1 Tax=Marasmiellus scandens TaxID=2682957 RepID=A0ABR1K1I8_9AGAR